MQSEEGCRNFKEVALKLLNHFKEKLPFGAEIICPFQDNKINEIEFGVRKANSLKQDPIQKRVPFDEQVFFKFTPNKTKLTGQFVKQLKQKRVIAIFPRYRETRRPDKNWSKEKYEDLIKMLKMQFPTHKLAIFGAPNGAYFSEGCPEDVMDLINIDPKERTNIQAAILERADFAVGSLSGAMVFARFCGVPVMTWSLERDKDRFHDENRLDIPTYFISNRDPSVIQVFQIIKDHFDNKTGLRKPFKEWSSKAYFSTGNGYAQKHLDSFKKTLRLMFYAKN